ncbi:MAG: efflux RND transporter periplasmic adaptor subunit [Hyphomicrobiales bacterium]|nr:efflux RND transporter periplasmic adaptor subunit [Hyphomicrobiales bacterium]
MSRFIAIANVCKAGNARKAPGVSIAGAMVRCAAAALVIAAASGMAAGQAIAADSGAAKTGEAAAPRVTVAKAKKRHVTETVTVTGTLVPREEVLAGAQIDGLRIVDILAEEGDRVKKGQVLVRLSRDTLDAQIAQSDAALARSDAAIAQARSQIAAAEATLKYATADLERAQTLIKRGVSTQAAIDQKTSVANTARAQLQVARDTLRAALADKKNLQAQRRELMVRVSRAEIRAPAGGIVTNRNAKLGAMVSAAGQPLFRIIRDGQIELDGEVPEQNLLDIRQGQKTQIILANGVKIAGTVRLVSPQIDPATRLGHVRIALDNSELARIGAFARGEVRIREADSITVPASAILYDGTETRVQIADNGVVRARKVKLGLLSGGFAEILSGLKEGERVVRRAGAFLRDGDAITAVESKAEAL